MKKGQVSIFITFLFIAIIIITIAGVLAPIGVRFNTEMLVAGEKILNESQPSIALIQDETVRNSINNVTQEAIDAGENNINVNASIFRYSAIIMLVLAGLVTFLYTRQLVEVSGRGGFV